MQKIKQMKYFTFVGTFSLFKQKKKRNVGQFSYRIYRTQFYKDIMEAKDRIQIKRAISLRSSIKILERYIRQFVFENQLP